MHNNGILELLIISHNWLNQTGKKLFFFDTEIIKFYKYESLK